MGQHFLDLWRHRSVTAWERDWESCERAFFILFYFFPSSRTIQEGEFEISYFKYSDFFFFMEYFGICHRIFYGIFHIFVYVNPFGFFFFFWEYCRICHRIFHIFVCAKVLNPFGIFFLEYCLHWSAEPWFDL